eukprot:scaffold131033_cov19-Prasinocladus_malaysianus.AAC.1
MKLTAIIAFMPCHVMAHFSRASIINRMAQGECKSFLAVQPGNSPPLCMHSSKTSLMPGDRGLRIGMCHMPNTAYSNIYAGPSSS